METQKTEICEQHGEFISRLQTKPNGDSFWSGCPKCILEQINAESVARNADLIARNTAKKLELAANATHRNALNDYLKTNQIPRRYQDMTFDDLRLSNLTPADQAIQKTTYDKLRRYAENFSAHKEAGRCITLYSDNFGSGKTLLALLIAKEIRKEKFEFVFNTMEGYLKAVKSTFSKDAQFSEYQILNRLTTIDLLVMDDVKICFDSLTEQNILFNIINERYLNQLPTIFTTNLIGSNKTAPKEGCEKFRDCIGARNFDRILENQPAFFPFWWDSFRISKVA